MKTDIDKLIDYINKNIDNNPEHELLVKPSDFGFSPWSDGTAKCKALLLDSGVFSSIEIISSNLIRVKLRNQA